jgi:putative ABC transport system substrate-binding protein
MSRETLVWLVAIFYLTTVRLAEAQPNKVPRIGWLSAAPLFSSADRMEAFRKGLRELGYVEGKNIIIEWRGAEGKPDRVPTLVAELVQLKVDVIVTAGSGATRPVKEATSTIPIVMAQDQDPIGNGFVASLARPSGNITGLSRLAPELSGKHVELLKEVVSRLSRLAVIGTSTRPAAAEVKRQIELAAGALGVKLQYLDVQGPNDFETAFREASKGHADAALWQVGGPIASDYRKRIAELAVKSRLPTIYEQRATVEAGGLMSYGVNFPDLDRRAAYFVDRILKGAKPSDLPVEQPTKFELVINLKAAKQIGFAFPPKVLMWADEIIK